MVYIRGVGNLASSGQCELEDSLWATYGEQPTAVADFGQVYDAERVGVGHRQIEAGQRQELKLLFNVRWDILHFIQETA